MKTMKIYVTLIIGLCLIGCAINKYAGIWYHDGKSEIAFITFKEDGNCQFTFAGKGAMDGISPLCTYVVKDDSIEVTFEAVPGTKERDFMLLRYDKTRDMLISTVPELGGYTFEFKKRDNL